MWLTQVWRLESPVNTSVRPNMVGGVIVYLQNSEPGVATGHKFHVIETMIVAGQETLGQTLATTSNLDRAIDIASQRG